MFIQSNTRLAGKLGNLLRNSVIPKKSNKTLENAIKLIKYQPDIWPCSKIFLELGKTRYNGKTRLN